MQVVTFGCRLNSFESALIRKIAGDLPNVIVVNSCAVTGEAERQCRQTIRRLHRENPTQKIIVTGCAAQIHPEVYARMPEVFRVLGNREKLNPEAYLREEKIDVSNVRQTPEALPFLNDFDGRHRAFLQIQQGCDHACTYCVVPLARGKSFGILPDHVIRQAQLFVEKGITEIVLTGVDVTAYPYDFCNLVRRLLTEVSGIKRLRFGSLDPACLTDDFISLVRENPVVMPYFHLSVQSGDNLILKRMGRRHLREDVVRFAQAIRAIHPLTALGADFITGFPTETEEMFAQTMALVEEAGLTHLHVFPYSVRPGTPAAKMPMVEMAIRRDRAARLRQKGERQYATFLDQFVGKKLSVLAENTQNGLTEHYVRVRFEKERIAGNYVDLFIKRREKNELVG